jgi:hypothetical protein
MHGGRGGIGPPRDLGCQRIVANSGSDLDEDDCAEEQASG